jgi:hypothetical protein
MKPHALCAALLPCVEEHRTCPIRVAAAAGH